MFGVGALTFLLSTELLIVEHGLAEFVTFWAAIAYLARKFGSSLGTYLNKMDSVSVILKTNIT